MMADAIFMASSTPTFEEMAPFACRNGIPSITLLGSKADWTNIANKFTQLEKGLFGHEPSLYAHSLRPNLVRFIATFDTPNSPTIRLFWNDMVTLSARQLQCEMTDSVSGWINALHFWDASGNLLLPQPKPLTMPLLNPVQQRKNLKIFSKLTTSSIPGERSRIYPLPTVKLQVA